MPSVAVVFPPQQPPERLRDVALAAENAGLEELWLWEDCFYESGVAPAAAVLAWTRQLSVGISLMPVPLRNVALAAMEIATIARLFPDRFVAGIGHGILDWMGQAGVRARSPVTLLREYSAALRSLLHGESVTTDGEYVKLTDVGLVYPPDPVPPLLIGAVGPKTVAIAGELGDGVLLGAGDETPEVMRESLAIALEARRASGIEAPFDVTVGVDLAVDATVGDIEQAVRPYFDAGANRVPLCGVDADGMPDGSDRVLGFVEAVAEVHRRLT